MGVEKGTETRRVWGEHFQNVLLLGGKQIYTLYKGR